jgi:hypothetical protein
VADTAGAAEAPDATAETADKTEAADVASSEATSSTDGDSAKQAAACKAAKVLVDASGAKRGHPRDVQVGVLQVTSPNSTQVSEYGV